LLLALLDSLTTTKPFSVDHFAGYMLGWRRDGKYTPDGRVFDVGMQTNTAPQQIAKGTPANQAGPADERDNGNGALMRAGVDAEAVRLARVQGLPTHGHLTSQLCCAYYVLIARRLFAGQGFFLACDEAASALARLLYGHEVDAFLALLSERKPGAGTGYVVDCVWSALDVVGMAASYEDAVKAAVALGMTPAPPPAWQGARRCALRP
jgi:ADP-ribosyl-[dinitrogen reductase] hydrolase